MPQRFRPAEIASIGLVPAVHYRPGTTRGAFIFITLRSLRASMSSGERQLDRRDRALQRAARRLRLLKIEMHRVKAELARLEAEYEDQVADRLSFGLRRRPTDLKVRRADAASASVPSRPHIELD